MKPPIFVVFLLFGTLFCTGLHGQVSFDNLLSKYDSQDKPDSAYMLIDRYTNIYTANEQWDSLVYAMHQKCNLYFRFESINEVETEIEKTDKVAEQYLSEDNLIYLDFLNFKADVKSDIGEYKEAEKILNRIIKIGSNFKDDSTGVVEYSKAEKAFLLLHMGRVKEAEELARSVYEGIMGRGDSSQMISLLQSLTIANQWLNRYDEALNYNKENLRLVRGRFGDTHPNIGLIQSQMAELYGAKGQINKALEYYNKSKNIHLNNFKKSGVSRFLSNTIGNLGDFYSDIGEQRLAIDHMEYSLDLVVKEYGANTWRLMWHYSVLSTANRLYGDYDKADFYIDKAFDLISKSDQSTPYDYNLFLSRKAEMLYTRNKFDEALPLALEVYNFYQNNEEYGSTNDRLHILNLITDIYRESGDVENALKWSKNNIDYHNENTEPLSSMRINVLTSYLTLLTDIMDSTQAFVIKDEILKLRNKGGSDLSLSNCIPDQELLYFSASWVDFLVKMASENEKYKSEYFKFIEDFEKYYNDHLSTIKTNSNLASNESFIKQIFAPGIFFLLDSDPEQALLIIEKCKNFSTRQILQSQLIDDKNLPTLDYTLSDSPELQKSNNSVDVFFNLTASLDSISNYKDSLYKADKTKYEKYFGVKKLSINDIREIIREDELVVEYLFVDSSVFVFYVDHSAISGEKYRATYIDSLAHKVLDSSDKEAGKILRATLLSDEQIKGYKKLRILADGILNSISFEQLMYEGQPLIFSKSVSYGLSASVLIYQEKLTKKKNNKNQFLGLTPGFTRDLKSKMDTSFTNTDSTFNFLLQQPFLLSLSESLSRVFDGETYEEADATENVFKTHAQDFQILHIGTHGILNDNSPLFSKLIFAKDSLEDGYLHAYELYGENLNAELAVLSACSSGKERTYASEGVVSLSHAFTHAGCPSVLMTKWDVDEKSTSKILENFYSNLRKGMFKSEALRDAKLTFLKNSPTELHDPYYWAGLVLIGDDSALFTQSWYATKWGIGLLILGVAVLLFFVLKRMGLTDNY